MVTPVEIRDKFFLEDNREVKFKFKLIHNINIKIDKFNYFCLRFSIL